MHFNKKKGYFNNDYNHGKNRHCDNKKNRKTGNLNNIQGNNRQLQARHYNNFK